MIRKNKINRRRCAWKLMCFILHNFLVLLNVYKVLRTYPAPNSNSVFVNETHFDELPKNTEKDNHLSTGQ